MSRTFGVCLLIAFCMPVLAAGQQSAPVGSKSTAPESRPKPGKRVRPDYVRRDRVVTFGATPVSVAQLEEVVGEAHGGRDKDVARRLSGLELTERLSAARLQLWETALPGKKARAELAAMADASVFLEPPAVEIPALEAPDMTTQQHMLAQTVDYLDKSIPKLPSFSILERVARYEDAMEEPDLDGEAEPSVQPWHATGSFKNVGHYSKSTEAARTGDAKGSPQNVDQSDQETNSVFGPLLSTVVVDAARGKITWSRWEQSEAGPRGVFRYEVPEPMSHYKVTSHSRSENGHDVVVQKRTSYHGEIAIDPTSGIISRITLLADIVPGTAIDRSDMMLEYGPVQMGATTYNVPVRSITISTEHSELQDDSGAPIAVEETTLLDVTFGKYEMKGSELTSSTGPAAP